MRALAGAAILLMSGCAGKTNGVQTPSSLGGAWTLATLRAIEARPGVLAAKLAHSLGRPRDDFKRDVRKLKTLGLTFSLEIGYRLTPKGEALLASLSRRG